jgi:hypothetical protein
MRSSALLVATALFLAASTALAQGASRQVTDVVGQGDFGPLVQADGAVAVRTPHGVSLALHMPTPAPGTYVYPPPNAFQDAVFQGAPEVFTGWAFVFNYPENCSLPCNGDDLGDTPARGGVYNFAGHIVGGDHLQFAGHISVGEEPFFAAPGVPLENPYGAEIHLAVAPHGTLQPDALPTQITTPIGTPAHWWLAFLRP